MSKSTPLYDEILVKEKQQELGEEKVTQSPAYDALKVVRQKETSDTHYSSVSPL